LRGVGSLELGKGAEKRRTRAVSGLEETGNRLQCVLNETHVKEKRHCALRRVFINRPFSAKAAPFWQLAVRHAEFASKNTRDGNGTAHRGRAPSLLRRDRPSRGLREGTACQYAGG
jgi:hypothetical protein